MSIYPKVTIRDNRIDAIRRRHPWIFSGAIKKRDDCADGDIVRVCTRAGECLGVGYYQDSSIMVRLLTFEDRVIDDAFWKALISKAVRLRIKLGLPSEDTNAFRLIHGEGDGIPGLIIDIYGDVAVVQCHAIGIHKVRDEIANALREALDRSLSTIYIKSGQTLPSEYASYHPDYFLEGEKSEVRIAEHGCPFNVNIVTGQKTGFFLDQRENRALLKLYAQDQNVLNLFSYTGGFSMYALQGGASEVTSVDASAKAMDLCDQNVALLQKSDAHHSVVADVNAYLKDIASGYHDIIIVDPPAFAKSRRKSHNAIQAYKRVNAAAIRKVKKDGLIFTFSCSQVIDAALFYNTIMAAAIEAARPCQVIHHLSQGPDHPVSIFHPEGKYLKGLVLKVS